MESPRGTATPAPIRRRLTEIEYVNWCFGQPYNMAVAIRLRGSVTAQAVRAAVAGLQRRHPLLGVTIVVDEGGTPWLDSAGVTPVPVRVVEATGPDDATRLLGDELTTPFPLDHPPAPPGDPAPARPPLLRVAVVLPPGPAADPDHGGDADGESPVMDVVLCAQHVVADGMSMFFLVRDLVRLLRDPDAEGEPVDDAARHEWILPPEAARRLHRTPTAALATRAALRVLTALRRPGSDLVATDRLDRRADWVAPVHSWELTPELTAALLHRCRQEGVSVQSALCTAFLPSYSAVNTPISLRARLGVPVGEAVGLYVGNAVVLRAYRPRHDFWWNARAFHRRLRRGMRDPFLMMRFCSPAVPRPVVHDVMTGMMALVGRRRPLAVTNLGVLDGAGLTLDAGHGPSVESFHGGMSGFATASVVTVYTIDGAMRLHLRGRPFMTAEEARSEAEGATRLLVQALAAPGSSRLTT